MQVKLAYGKSGHVVSLPDGVTVIRSKYVQGLKDEIGAIKRSIESPIGTGRLADMVKKDSTVAIVVSDITRPVPSDKILPPLLGEISVVDRENITIIVATGTHRSNTTEELCLMLGEDIVKNYRIINHNAFDKDTLTSIGKNCLGNEVWVNKVYMESDVKILTGFIEPHFFAGFSGGRKSVFPGIIGQANLMTNHGAHMIDNPLARYGILDGNPIHEEMLDTALMTGVDFIVNVCLNSDHHITGVFSGDLVEAHKQGVKFVKDVSMQQVPSMYDIVITTNSGYPLDQNLYQAVKGMSAAEGIVKAGGAIIIASECSDGVGSDEFCSILGSRETPDELIEMIHEPDFYVDAQWQVQILARILSNFQVYLYSDGITEDVAKKCHLIPVKSIEETIEKLKKRYGPGAKIAVMPEGPMAIPYAE
jgi:nickel-dependent lactate racemase